MTVPSAFQPSEPHRRRSRAPGPIQELRRRNPLALRMAERITPCHLDLGERAVGESAQQFCSAAETASTVCVTSRDRLVADPRPMTAPSVNAATSSPTMTQPRRLSRRPIAQIGQDQDSEPPSPTNPSAGAIRTRHCE